MVIHVKGICDAADTGAQGELLFAAMMQGLRQGDNIVLSFAGVPTATSSFINASFVQLLSFMTFDEIKRRVVIKDSSRQINEMIKRRLSREAEIAV